MAGMSGLDNAYYLHRNGNETGNLDTATSTPQEREASNPSGAGTWMSMRLT